MNNFNISRINTSYGTFRVSGSWSNENDDCSTLSVESIEVMGTDGWASLNQSSDNVIKLIKQLTPILCTHLQVNR